MQTLRIALFTGNYHHIKDGVSLTLNRLVDYLLRKNNSVKIYGPTVDKPEIDHVGDFTPVPSMPMPGRSEYRLTVGFPEKVRDELRNFEPDLVHLATPDWLGFRALRFAQQNNYQIVSSYHTHFTSYLKYYNLDVIKPIGWRYLAWFYNRCRHIYVPTQTMADELKRNGITDGIRFWERGVDTDQLNPRFRSMEWRRERGIKDNEFLVTFVSRLVWEKGLQTFVDTIKKLKGGSKNIRAMVVGEGPVRGQLEEMLTNAHFTGFLTGDELASAYASSDVFLFPSDTETFGNVTLEAMACGLPVVVADAAGSKSLVEPGVNGFLADPVDPSDFARNVRRIIHDDQLRRKMGRAARQKAKSYEWDKVNQELLEHYQEAFQSERPKVKF